jgi:hypothetical protein
VAVALINSRVTTQTVNVFLPIYIPDPDSRALGENYREWSIIMAPVFELLLDEGVRFWRMFACKGSS